MTTYDDSHHRRDDHEWWQPEVLHNTSTDDQLWGDWNWPNVTTCPDSDHRRDDLIRFDQISTWSNSPFPPLRSPPQVVNQSPNTELVGTDIKLPLASWCATHPQLKITIFTLNRSSWKLEENVCVHCDNMWLWRSTKVSRQIFTCYDVTITRWCIIHNSEHSCHKYFSSSNHQHRKSECQLPQTVLHHRSQ